MDGVTTFFASLPTIIQILLGAICVVCCVAMYGYNIVHGPFPRGEISKKSRGTFSIKSLD
ncbi:MAG: hypothetical protein Q7S53_02685 [bacterium]|nr:hypothetical protein [bacterium]